MTSSSGSTTNSLPTGSRRKKRDPSIIEKAPIVPDETSVADGSEKKYLQIIGSLSAELEDLRAENGRLREKQAVDIAIANLITPFSNKIFRFVVGYCCFVAAALVASGFAALNFRLPESVLTTLVGSTAVAVLALIGSVVAGLFKRK